MNRIIIFLLLIVSSSLYAQQYDLEATYIPYRKGKLWGLADTSGNIVVEPQYDMINKGLWMKFGMFSVFKNQKWGMINSDGKIIIPLNYYSVFAANSIVVTAEAEEEYYHIDQTLYLYNYKGERYFDFPLLSESKALFRNLIIIKYYDSNIKYSGLALFDFDQEKISFSLMDYKSIRKVELENGKQYTTNISS